MEKGTSSQRRCSLCGPFVVAAVILAISHAVTTSLGLVGDAERWRDLAFRAAGFAVAAFFFAALYATVPNARVRWRDALKAGLFAAAAFILDAEGVRFLSLSVPDLHADLRRFRDRADLSRLALPVLVGGDHRRASFARLSLIHIHARRGTESGSVSIAKTSTWLFCSLRAVRRTSRISRLSLSTIRTRLSG